MQYIRDSNKIPVYKSLLVINSIAKMENIVPRKVFRTLLLWVCLIFMVSNPSIACYSQSTSSGLKLGLNVSGIGGDASGSKSITGFHGGFFLIALKTNAFSVQPEIIYSQQGGKIKESFGSGTVTLTTRYINFPLMFNFYPQENFFVQAGVQLGILVSAKINGTDARDQFNAGDFSGGIGLGYESEVVIVGFRYNPGISSVLKSSNGDVNFPNRVFQISLGIKLNKPEKPEEGN